MSEGFSISYSNSMRDKQPMLMSEEYCGSDTIGMSISNAAVGNISEGFSDSVSNSIRDMQPTSDEYCTGSTIFI